MSDRYNLLVEKYTQNKRKEIKSLGAVAEDCKTDVLLQNEAKLFQEQHMLVINKNKLQVVEQNRRAEEISHLAMEGLSISKKEKALMMNLQNHQEKQW